MMFSDRVWRTKNAGGLQDIHQVLSQASPRLIRVLQAYTLLYDPSTDRVVPVFDIRAVLNYSWDEMRIVICTLRGITGENESELGQVLESVHPTHIRALCPESTLRDLAGGSMQLMKMIGSHELPPEFR
jgi:hypothetical protein